MNDAVDWIQLFHRVQSPRLVNCLRMFRRIATKTYCLTMYICVVFFYSEPPSNLACRSVLIRGVASFSWVDLCYRAYIGSIQSGLNTGVTSFQGSRLEGVHCSFLSILAMEHASLVVVSYIRKQHLVHCNGGIMLHVITGCIIDFLLQDSRVKLNPANNTSRNDYINASYVSVSHCSIKMFLPWK